MLPSWEGETLREDPVLQSLCLPFGTRRLHLPFSFLVPSYEEATPQKEVPEDAKEGKTELEKKEK